MDEEYERLVMTNPPAHETRPVDRVDLGDLDLPEQIVLSPKTTMELADLADLIYRRVGSLWDVMTDQARRDTVIAEIDRLHEIEARRSTEFPRW